MAYETSRKNLCAFAEDPSSVSALDAVRSIRPVIEGLLRFKYSPELKRKQQVGQMIKAIEECENDSRLSRLRKHVKELYDVTKYSSKYIHADEPHSQGVPLDDEASSYIERALALLKLI